MIKDGGWPTGFRKGDAYAQTCHRVALKAWYDYDIEEVRMTPFAPQNVLIVRNPARPWSPYSAPAVLFRHTSVMGSGYRDVWEVWSTGDKNTPDAMDEARRPVWLPTAHYMTDGEKEWSINKKDENPFLDPNKDNQPIVPFAWMTDDGGTDLYVLGDEDLLSLNRVTNLGVTSLNISVLTQAFPIPTFHTESGKTAKIPDDFVYSPKNALKLPKGVELRFVSPALDISEPLKYYETLMKFDALFSGLGSDVVTAEQTQTAESGRALKIKQTRLEKLLEPLRENYQQPAEQAIYKGIIVRNYYADRVEGRVKIDLKKYKPVIIFGDLKVPIDDKEEGETFTVEIEHDVSTAVDWHMKKYGVSQAEAIKQIEANAETNKNARDAQKIIPPPQPPDDGEDIPVEDEDTEGDADQGDDNEE
jgi:hypothetical protein